MALDAFLSSSALRCFLSSLCFRDFAADMLPSAIESGVLDLICLAACSGAAAAALDHNPPCCVDGKKAYNGGSCFCTISVCKNVRDDVGDLLLGTTVSPWSHLCTDHGWKDGRKDETKMGGLQWLPFSFPPLFHDEFIFNDVRASNPPPPWHHFSSSSLEWRWWHLTQSEEASATQSVLKKIEHPPTYS